MASASSLLCDEQLLCSICLNEFTEPVSTPCGHNYCKACITRYWASCDRVHCPLCMRRFRKRPQLQVNTGFRDMMEHVNNTKVKNEGDVAAKPGEVSCDICSGPKLKAQKTCLVCLASYCQLHLEPHWRVTTLKKHQLIDPVSNLEDRVCQKHDKMLELFCHEDQTYVCFMCLRDDHATHRAVPLEHAFRERKVQLDNVTSEMKMKEGAKSKTIEKIKHSVEQSKRASAKEIAGVAEVFTAPLVSLQRSQNELIQVIQEKQREAQKQAEDHVTQLEQEVAESRRRRSEMEQLFQTEDHLRLLQSWPSLYFPAHTEDPHATCQLTTDLSDISQQSYVGMVKKAVAQMEKILSNKMQLLIRKVRFDGCEAAEPAEEPWSDGLVEEAWTPPQDKLMMIQQNDAVDVTLDAYSAHNRLTVSEDGKQLMFCQGLPSLTIFFGRRFQRQAFVLGKEGFSSGRFYYEVRVSGSKGWLLGVAKESVDREKLFFPDPRNGCWTLFGSYNGNQDGYFPEPGVNTPLLRPQKVGVFTDYEKGEVSFYDVDARALIYSYTGLTFTETISEFKSLLYFLAGASYNNRPKLYPIIGTFEDDNNDNTLEITPVAHTI